MIYWENIEEGKISKHRSILNGENKTLYSRSLT